MYSKLLQLQLICSVFQGIKKNIYIYLYTHLGTQGYKSLWKKKKVWIHGTNWTGGPAAGLYGSWGTDLIHATCNQFGACCDAELKVIRDETLCCSCKCMSHFEFLPNPRVCSFVMKWKQSANVLVFPFPLCGFLDSQFLMTIFKTFIYEENHSVSINLK